MKKIIAGAVGRRSGVSLGGKANFGAASVAVGLTRDTKQDYAVNDVRYKGKKYTNGLVWTG